MAGGAMAIVRGDFRSHLIPIAEVLFEAGLPAIEVTMDSPDALAAGLHDRFGIDLVVLSEGEQGAVAYDGKPHIHEAYEVEVVDRVGAGDAFAAGFLFGYLYDGQQMDNLDTMLADPSGTVKRGLAFGLALAALKHTYHGDISWSTRDDVLNLVHNHHPGWR